MIAVMKTTFCVNNGTSSEKISLSVEPFRGRDMDELECFRKEGQEVLSKLSGINIELFFDTTDNATVVENIKQAFPVWLAFPRDYVQQIIKDRKGT